MRDWTKIIIFPDKAEIALCNRISKERSPYICGWMETGSQSYKEYAIDFKADYLPCGTYCCLANFDLDYSGLKKHFRNIHTEYNGVAGYAGFQRLENGNYVSIMSFWDVYGTDSLGRKLVHTPRLVYPAGEGTGRFSGEGAGVHIILPYNWRPGKWYRMLLTCGTMLDRVNTVISMFAREVDGGKWTCLCRFDMGTTNVTFKNNTAIFLENFSPRTSGEIRTLECRNIKIKEKDNWKPVRTAHLSQSYNYPGSYQYGSDDSTFYMITTGVAQKAGSPQQPSTLHVREANC